MLKKYKKCVILKSNINAVKIMKKNIKSFLLFLFVVMLGFAASSYYFGSDVFNVESIINLIENKQSTSVLKIDDSNYNTDGGFYYSSLNDEEKRIYDKIYARAKNQKTQIKIRSNIDSERILEIAMFVYNEHPELFWLNGAFSIDTSGILTLKSSYNSNEIAKLSEQIKSKTDSIVQNLNSNMSDYEKSLYLYEYLITNTSYANEAIDNLDNMPWASSLVGVFTMGKCACTGYAKAYQYLLQLSGINCAVVSGKATTPQGRRSHAWAIQKCDGSYYYTDPTWGDCFDGNNKEYISHSYFCLSESEIEKTHTINHKDILPKCTANKDNYFVKNNLLYSSYSRADIKKALKSCVENGKYYAEFKFTNESAYNDANNELFKQGQIYYILSIMSLKNKNIDVKNIKYSNNDNLCIITIFFDKANN